MSFVGSYSTSWSQQNPPATDGRMWYGSMKCQVCPASSDFVVYQFPDRNTSPPDLPTLGSPTDDVWPPVLVSLRPIFEKSLIAIGRYSSSSGSVAATPSSL